MENFMKLFLILSFLFHFINSIVIKSKEEQDEMYLAGKIEKWNDLYGYQFLNVSYYYDNKDTYKEGENINYYDLYIPYSSTFNKNKTQGIIAFFHGAGDTKAHMNFLCVRYAKIGYITATIETDGCRNGKDKTFTPVMNAISSAIKGIQNKLLEFGFNSEKLELAIYGSSAGSLTSLLYGYSMAENCPIPLKFLINNVGPVTMEPYAWYSLKNLDEPLKDLEMETIENAIKSGKLIPSNENERINLEYMNFFVADDYSDEQYESMLDENGKIIYNNSDFIQLKNKYMQYCPLVHIKKSSVPTLCIYAGRDIGVSVMQYATLKKKLDENNVYSELVYMKYGGHNTSDYETENGINAMRETHLRILNFSKHFFSK